MSFKRAVAYDCGVDPDSSSTDLLSECLDVLDRQIAEKRTLTKVARRVSKAVKEVDRAIRSGEKP